ncbi:restriction modification enzyme [Yersinia intermedia]|uniref:Restriction modification enzyme n=1 Tax=Yersinia intermedia TaxID=631 RepID=A0A0H5LU72_YERIN|nr:restriction endonuclease subunit S [Yersinia intermedia]CRY54708.1 restriction modification enzyme [Yersinia intermedia]
MVELMVSEQQSGTAGKGVPVGFKLTEVGVIPEDWEVKTIGQLNPFITSGSRGWADFYVDYGDLFVRITNMSRNSIYLDTKTSENKFVALPATSTEGKRTQLSNGDILISITADIGIIGYIDESIAKPAYINQHISLVRFDDNSIDNKFVAYFLASENVQKKFLANSDLGAKAGMNLNGVRSIIFAVPAKKEQSAIANALADIDTLVVELKKALTKKQSIKTATMQQLLTGKTRLPQFALRKDGTVKGYKKNELGEMPEDWIVSTFGSVMKIRHGKNQKQVECLDGEYPIYATGGQIGKTNAFLYNKPSVLIGRKGTIDKPRYTDKPFWTVDTLFYSEISESADAQFIYYKFCTIDWMQYNEASGVPSLNAGTIERIQTILPSIEEQTAIAAILSDMDKDIQTLQQRLDKTRQLKQGMMQELLTGKTRLI